MILEYCEADILTCRALEQLYLDLYKPAYNTLPIAGTSLGYKHTAATKEHLSAVHTGPLHPQFGTVSSVSKRSGISLSLSQYFKLNPHHNQGEMPHSTVLTVNLCTVMGLMGKTYSSNRLTRLKSG